MSTETMTAPAPAVTGDKAKRKRSTKTKTPFNGLAIGTNIPDTGEAPKLGVARLGAPVLIAATADLNLVSRGENAITMPGLDRYPLAVSKTGAITGRFINIGDYCRQTTGLAFNQRQLDAVLEKEHIKLPGVISEERRKLMKEEFDTMRQAFWRDVKVETLRVHARQDVTIQSLGLKKVSKGYSIVTRAILNTTSKSAEETLRAKLAEMEQENAMLKKALPSKTVKRLISKAHEVTDVHATATAQTDAPVPPVQAAN